MSRTLLRALTLSFAVLIPGLCRASVATVPDDYATIQAAIDIGADTVFVRDGDYREVPQAYRGVVLLGLGARRPRLAGLAISNPYYWLSRSWTVEDIDVAGPATIETPNWQNRLLNLSFVDCRLAGGVQHDIDNSSDPEDIYHFQLLRCSVGAWSYGRSDYLEMHADTVDAGISWGVYTTASVDSSWFRGGTQGALTIWADLISGRIENNVMEDARTGFVLANCDEVIVRSNVVRRMTETGIQVGGRQGLIEGNRIEDCGTGLWSSIEDVTLTNNVCIRMRGTASYFLLPDRVQAEGNVIGHCGGAAVLFESAFRADLEFHRNTIYLAGASGIVLDGGGQNALAMNGNIVCEASDFGLLAASSFVSTTFGCNDWFGNGRGALSGVADSSADLSLDPGFCDLASDSVGLYSDSPLLTRSACGQIGARGAACSPPTLSAIQVASIHAGLRVQWAFATPPPSGSWIERAEQLAGPWDSLGTVGGGAGAGNAFEYLDAAVAPNREYHYRVSWKDRGVVVRGSPVSGTWTEAGRMSSVTPSPSHGEATVEWVLAHPGMTEIRVFDISGREVATVAKAAYDVGRHQAKWEGRWEGRGAAPAGMYLVRISSGDGVSTHRVLLLR